MPAKHHPWLQLDTKVWLMDPQLRKCKAASRGILADIMCLGDDGTPYGFLVHSGHPQTEKDIAKATGENYQTIRKALADLYQWHRINHIIIAKTGTISYEWSMGDPVIGRASMKLWEIVGPTSDPIIFVPRLVRDGVKYEASVTFGKMGGNPELAPGVNPKDKGGTLSRVNPDIYKEVDKEKREGITPHDSRQGPEGADGSRGVEKDKKADPQGAAKKLSGILHRFFDHEVPGGEKEPPQEGEEDTNA